MPPSAAGAMFEDGNRILEFLEGLLQLVPTVDRDDNGYGPSSLGDHQRVVAEIGELISYLISQAGFGDDPSRHDAKRTWKRT